MKRYPSYKPSGVEWIGEIPEHWELKRLKYVASPNPSNVDKKSVEGEEQVRLCNYTDVYNNELITGDMNLMVATATDDQIKKFTLRKGDVLATKDSEDRTDIAIPAVVKNDLPGVVCGYHLTHIRPDVNHIDGFYLFRLFQSYKFNQQFTVQANGITRYGLSSSVFSDAFVCIPPLDEQQTIAHYLTEKTSLIDETIRKKQQLIELLQEERTALINQAVTRGLNPNVKLKPSGVEWLGDVPEHWDIKRLKHLGKIKYGLGQPPKTKDGGLPLIRATNIFRGTIDENDMLFVDPDDIPWERDPVLKTDDIIVVRSGAYTADSAIIPEKFDGAITGYDMVLRVVHAIPAFISYCLLSDYVLMRQLYLLKLRAAQPHLNREELGDTLIVLPPEQEQDSIAAYIKRESNKIEQTISTINREISLLQEYRTALINEVVTGKRCVVPVDEEVFV